MNERPDIESEPAAQSDEIAKVYTWDGKLLLPFSAHRQTAYIRLDVSNGAVLEAACALVRLCQMPVEEVVLIRGKRCAEFLKTLGDWMEEEGIGMGDEKQAKSCEVIDIHSAIFGDIYAAERLAPASTGNTGGNG